MIFREPAHRWMLVSFCGAAGLAWVILGVFGMGERGTAIALQGTGRYSFILFFAAYIGEPIARLTKRGRNRFTFSPRTLGLAFASAQLVHLSLVAWLCYIGLAPPRGTFVLFGVAVVATYLLALNSYVNLASMFGALTWRITRFFSLQYIAAVFAMDFLTKAPAENAKYIVGYLPFAAMAVLGPALRIWLQVSRAAAASRNFVAPLLRGRRQIVANSQFACDYANGKPQTVSNRQSEWAPSRNLSSPVNGNTTERARSDWTSIVTATQRMDQATRTVRSLGETK